MSFTLCSMFIMARTDHGAGVNTCWGPGNCLPEDAARCGTGFGDCSGCNMAPSTLAHCWGHADSLVNGERYCNSMIVPGTHGMPSNVCSDATLWNEHQVIQCYQGQVQRYCNSGYVLRQTNGQAHCDESTEFMPRTQAACQQAANALNRGLTVGNPNTAGGPLCAVDARNGHVNVRWNGLGSTTSSWGGNHLGWLAVCTVAPPSPPPRPPPPSPLPSAPLPSPPPPLPPPPLPPPPDLTMIYVGAGGGGALFLVSLLTCAVCAVRQLQKKGKAPSVPPAPKQSAGLPGQASNAMQGQAANLQMAQVAQPVVPDPPQPVVDVAEPVVAEPVTALGVSLWMPKVDPYVDAPRFDGETGQPIPKFDPQTGKQNW